MGLLKNRWFLGFAAAYALAVGWLVASGTYSPAEPLAILAIFGVLLPLCAGWLCRKCRPLPVRADFKPAEIVVVAACVLFVTAYLVWGSGWVNGLLAPFTDGSPRLAYLLKIAKKLVVFVALPYLLFARLFGYSWRDYGLSRNLRSVFAPRYLVLLLVMAALYCLVQALVGQGARPVFRGDYAIGSVVAGILLLYPLLVIEVGLVEEFFFRAIVQARLAAWLKSDAAGLFGMAVIFGLAHAPGLYLRGAGAVTALGASPGPLTAAAYSIAILSLAGLTFGVIWARTRNLLVLMLIHACVDLLPGLPEFIDTFGL